MAKSLAKRLSCINLLALYKPDKSASKGKKDKEAFEKTYSVGHQLGNGGFGTVYAGTCKRDGKNVALKYMRKDRIAGWVKENGESLPMEICLLQRLTHVDGVVQLIDYYERSNSFVLVLERPPSSMDLFDYITENGSLEEDESRLILKQVVEILLQVRQVGIIHRDLKDENLLIEPSTKRIRLIDFGSGAFDREALFKDFDGTRVYSPPEWIRERQYRGMAATSWSVGVLLFDLVTGDVPFCDDGEILKAKFSFNKDLSSEVKDLISACLSLNPDDRPTLEQIAGHKWMTTTEGPTDCSTLPDTSKQCL